MSYEFVGRAQKIDDQVACEYEPNGSVGMAVFTLMSRLIIVRKEIMADIVKAVCR